MLIRLLKSLGLLIIAAFFIFISIEYEADPAAELFKGVSLFAVFYIVASNALLIFFWLICLGRHFFGKSKYRDISVPPGLEEKQIKVKSKFSLWHYVPIFAVLSFISFMVLVGAILIGSKMHNLMLRPISFKIGVSAVVLLMGMVIFSLFRHVYLEIRDRRYLQKNADRAIKIDRQGLYILYPLLAKFIFSWERPTIDADGYTFVAWNDIPWVVSFKGTPRLTTPIIPFLRAHITIWRKSKLLPIRVDSSALGDAKAEFIENLTAVLPPDLVSGT